MDAGYRLLVRLRGRLMLVPIGLACVLCIALLVAVIDSATRAHDRAERTWHVIERPHSERRDSYDDRPSHYSGDLEVCVGRHTSRFPMVIGQCDFDDYDKRADLVLIAEQRAAHLNSVRNEA